MVHKNLVFTESSDTDFDSNHDAENDIQSIQQRKKILVDQINSLKNNTLFNNASYEKKIAQLDAKLNRLNHQLHTLKEQTNIEINEIIERFVEKENELKNSINTYNQTHEDFKQKFEDLLPSAVSAGLASSYRQAKNSFNKNIYIYGIATIALYITLIVFGWKNIEFYQMTLESPSLIDVFTRILLQFPFIGLLIWLTSFISSKLNEAIRLQQEYAHKEAIAGSYGSFKQQIESLESDSQSELLERLMAELITSVSFNPSKTLDKYATIKSPIESGAELADTIIDSGIKIADKVKSSK